MYKVNDVSCVLSDLLHEYTGDSHVSSMYEIQALLLLLQGIHMHLNGGNPLMSGEFMKFPTGAHIFCYTSDFQRRPVDEFLWLFLECVVKYYVNGHITLSYIRWIYKSVMDDTEMYGTLDNAKIRVATELAWKAGAFDEII